MATLIRFAYVGEPLPQPRQKFRRAGRRVIPYLDPTDPIHEYKKRIADACRVGTAVPLAGPLTLSLVFRLRRDGRVNLSIPRAGFPAYSGSYRPPDLDNLAKAVMDALNKIAWNDDQQVCEIVTRKSYIAYGGTPGVVVRVGTIATSQWDDFGLTSFLAAEDIDSLTG